MKDNIHVLFISSEIAPFAKTGGLADVSGALPQYLADERINICLLMPLYGSIDQKRFNIKPYDNKTYTLKAGNINIDYEISICKLPGTEIDVFFLKNDSFYKRESLYVNPANGRDWEDNVERYLLLSKASLEIINHINFMPNILHINDWQTSLVPLYLMEKSKKHPSYKEIKTLLSIHNIAYQGIFEIEKFDYLGLPEEHIKFGGALEFWGRMNILKAGIFYSDLLTTVSKTYAMEIQKSEEFGYGLEGILTERRDDLHGVLNGIDYNVWNPLIDEHIQINYGIESLHGKKENKKLLLRSINMKYDDKIPLIGFISRLVDQKGIDLIQDRIYELMELDLQFIILGTGERKYHNFFQEVQKMYPEKVAVFLEFNNKLAHQIEASCDIFLMPSKYEPCGLNQMYSLKYGTVPIVRNTGGLADTVKDFDPVTKRGNGFVFESYDSAELLKTVKRAINNYKKSDIWQIIVENGMVADFSWRKSAIEYIKLYRKLMQVS